ncbi:MAG: ABC transporter substrate-binding protein [Oscillospiraceae bacterium]|nr:ABC transporter substrate-binding protein [Oscillospiraceae bacterium]
MKKLLSLILAASLAFSLCGCGSETLQESETSSVTTTEEVAVSETLSTASEETITAIAEEKTYTYEAVSEKYPDKTVLTIAISSQIADYSSIIEKANEYLDSLDKDYVICFRTVQRETIQYSDIVSYPDFNGPVEEIITSGEKLDILCVTDYRDAVERGLLINLDDLIDGTEVGNHLKVSLPDNIFRSVTIDGSIYGINCYEAISLSAGILVNAELADKYGYDCEKSLLEQIDILRTVATNESDCETLVSFVTLYAPSYYISEQTLTDGVYWDDTEKVAKSILDNEDYITWLKTIYTLNREELLTYVDNSYKSEIFAYESPLRLMGSGNGIKFPIGYTYSNGLFTTSYMNSYTSYSVEYQLSKASQAVGICKSSGNIEYAFDFITLIFTDESMNNIMCYGDYESIICEDGRVDSQSVTSAFVAMFGNDLIRTPTTCELSDRTEIFAKAVENAFVSEDFDFMFDDTSVATECGNVIAVITEMASALDNNILDTSKYPTFDEYISDFRNLLEEAGINDIIAEANRQYVEWRESQQ